jgi:Domain of unknown function (DUF4386)
MTQQLGIVKGDAFQKLGSAGLIIGAILMVIGGLLMPYAAKLTSNVQEMLKPLGENEFRAQVSSLLMIMGIWAIMIGATGVYRSITASGAAWARLGFYFIIVGTAVWTVTLSQDVATASAAANWLAASAAGKEAAYSALAAVNAVNRGLYPMTIIVYWLSYTFLGIAMVLSNVYPRWLGWVGLILANTVVAVGIIQTFTARSTTFTLVFAVLSLLTTLWVLVVGIWIARKAW